MVAALPDTDMLITRIVEAAAFLTGADRASLLLLDDSATTLIQRGVRTSRGLTLTSDPIEDALAWRAVRSAQPVAGQPTLDESDGMRKVQLCAPVVAGGTALGALSAHLPADAATEHQLFLLGSLADYAAIALK
jgi:hypothetical protein